MSILFNISVRNLLRQKRRNFLLGIAIAFGMMILVIANSFAYGISDVLLNKIVVYLFGHINIAMSERGNFQNMMIRDKERFKKIILDNIPDIKEITEGVGGFGRIIGNGKSDNIALAGVKPSAEFYNWCRVIQGDIRNYENKNIENPIILSETKAKYLNLKVNDIARLRVNNVWGQTQTARLTVIAIVKLENVFMEYALYLNIDDLKRIMGYRSWEIGTLLVNLKNPRNAVEYADKLHSKFKPELAAFRCEVISGKLNVGGIAAALNKDDTSFQIFNNHIKIISGAISGINDKKTVIITKKFADYNKLTAGGSICIRYAGKFENRITTDTFSVAAIVEPKLSIADNIVILSENAFFPMFYDNLPAAPLAKNDIFGNLKNSEVAEVASMFAPEWELLKRTGTTEELSKKIKETAKHKRKISRLDIQTMYESASAILKLEYALKLITVIAVLVLFFIILIGVVNTLRMTIRERTREIGTMRAIGMHKKDVKNSFILETFILTFISCAVGTALAFLAMQLLTYYKFDTADSFLSILLVVKHLHFVPNWGSIVFNYILILAISVATAYFPARRAANLEPTAALRYYG